jgi:hypothetical protein
VSRGWNEFCDICESKGYKVTKDKYGRRSVEIPGCYVEAKITDRLWINEEMRRVIGNAYNGEAPVFFFRSTQYGWIAAMPLDDWFRMKEGDV